MQVLDLIRQATDPAADPWELLQVLGTLLVLLAGGIIAVAGAAAVVWRIVRGSVLGYLRRELIEPIKDTHRQVTVNGGKNNPPTLPDLLDKAATSVEVAALRAEAATSTEVAQLREVVARHILQSSGSRGEITAHLDRVDAVLETLALGQAALWPAIQAVAEASPPSKE